MSSTAMKTRTFAPAVSEALVGRRSRSGSASRLRHPESDAWLVGAALLEGALAVLVALLAARAGVVGAAVLAGFVAVMLWWTSNTVAHNHLHAPLFRSSGHNRAFSLYLSALVGVPQTVWRARHLWHHAGEPVKQRVVHLALLPEVLADRVDLDLPRGQRDKPAHPADGPLACGAGRSAFHGARLSGPLSGRGHEQRTHPPVSPAFHGPRSKRDLPGFARLQAVVLGAHGRLELALVAAVWMALATAAPRLFVLGYLPGYLLGLVLCSLQGRFEHGRRGAPGISHYGALYNLLWFNDGHHVEHHRRPAEHWSRLPALRREGDPGNDWPPLLRWVDGVAPALNLAHAALLGALERLPLTCPFLRRFMVERHARAIGDLLSALSPRPLRRVVVVGGGLFPRSVLALRQLLPTAHLVVVDGSAANIAEARRFLEREGQGASGVDFVEAYFDARSLGHNEHGADLFVLPLAFVGCRRAPYESPLSAPTLVHDWIWKRGGAAGALVSWLLLKRINLVLPGGARPGRTP